MMNEQAVNRETIELQAEIAQREMRFDLANKYFEDPTASFQIMETRRQKQFLWQIQRPKIPTMRRD